MDEAKLNLEVFEQEFEEHYSDAELAMHEPGFVEAINKAHLANQMLAIGPVTRPEIGKIVADLIDEVSLYAQPSSFLATGRGLIVDKNDDDESNWQSVILTSTRVKMAGYKFDRDKSKDHLLALDNDDEAFYKLRLALKRQLSLDDGTTVEQGIVTEIDDIHLVPVSYVSLARAGHYLRVFHTPLYEEVNYQMLNQEEEEGAILSLSDVEVENVPAEGTPEYDSLIAALDVYLDRTIELDITLPYVCDIYGALWQSDNDGEAFRPALYETSDALLNIKGFRVMPQIKATGDRMYADSEAPQVIGVYGYLFSGNKYGAPIPVKIPINCLMRLNSVRKIYYGEPN